MRVLLDTSVLISNLRSPTPATSATGVMLRAAFAGAFTILFVEGVAEDLHRKLDDRADRAARISKADAARLLGALPTVAELVPRLPEPYPEVGRDRDDDFLIAHAILAEADWLISRDKDLLDLGQLEGLTFTDPPRFLTALRDAGLLDS